MAINISRIEVDRTPVVTRALRIFAFDPSLGKRRGNIATLRVTDEKLKSGPSGSVVQVIDYDSTNKLFYRPVDLDDHDIVHNDGLEPSASNPQFHQQMVYAVASETIRHFSFALGRPARWGYRRNEPLRLFPHALYEANAFYSRDLKGVAFGYFRPTVDDGSAGPDELIYTCLSHDIIAHEVTHALIDGQRRSFMLATGFDTPAFHEAFADIVALFQHFRFKEALLDTVQRTAGMLHRLDLDPDTAPVRGQALISAEQGLQNPLVQLAKQFGEAMGQRSSLREALGTPPDPRALESALEAHDRGAILVAAVFDAFFSIYLDRTRSLLRIAKAGGSQLEPGNLHPDLASYLADEAGRLAEQFLNICIRAIDYCPPVDVTFGDFLRALITADHDLVDDDDLGYREAIIQAFRMRGIYPAGVRSFSEAELIWAPFEHSVPPLELTFPLGWLPKNDEQQRQFDRERARNAKRLIGFANAHRPELGLHPDVNLRVAAESFHLVQRVGPDGQLRLEVVVQLLQRRKVGKELLAIGGTTLVIDMDGRIRYAVAKPLGAPNRVASEAQFRRHLLENSVAAQIAQGAGLKPINFKLTHGGF